MSSGSGPSDMERPVKRVGLSSCGLRFGARHGSDDRAALATVDHSDRRGSRPQGRHPSGATSDELRGSSQTAYRIEGRGGAPVRVPLDRRPKRETWPSSATIVVADTCAIPRSACSAAITVRLGSGAVCPASSRASSSRARRSARCSTSWRSSRSVASCAAWANRTRFTHRRCRWVQGFIPVGGRRPCRSRNFPPRWRARN